MENLDSLKNLWKNQGESSIKFSRDQIHDMVQKKSSSIVRWILVLSILEFILPNLLFLFRDIGSSQAFYQEYGLENTMRIYGGIHILIIIGFIYVFYKNYKTISVGSSVKKLLSDILKTRRTVKNYIYYNLTMMGIIGVNIFYVVYHSPKFINNLPEGSNMIMVWTISIALLTIVLFVFWAFYRLIYGFFLRKLKRNHRALMVQNGL